MWTDDEIRPGVLMRSYDLREMRLGMFSGEPAAARHLKGRGAADTMLDRARAT